MRLKFLALGFVMAGAALLSACGGGDDNNNSGNVKVRLLNASVGYSSLDLVETDATGKLNSAVTFGNLGSYADLGTGTKGLQVRATGNDTNLVSPSTASLIKDRSLTVIAWGQSGSAAALVLDEEEAAPEANSSKLLVFNFASGSGTLDTYVTETTTNLNDVSANAPSVGVGRGDSYRTLTSKAYRLRVTAAGSKSDIRLDVPAVTLASTKVYALILTSASGGNMVNATLLEYKGAAQQFQNGTANVRVISALPRGATLSAAVNGTTLLTEAGSPVVSNYANVTVTNGADLTWSVNGTARTPVNVALERSITYGLLVWGDPAAPTVSSVREDSVLPINAGTAKVRVLHGAQGLGTVNLVVNLSPSQSNIAAGSLSAATEVRSGDELQIEVRAGANTVFNEKRTLVSGGNYVLYLSGVAGSYEARLVQQL
jgi:Domain of unknown function (DUF4397)